MHTNFGHKVKGLSLAGARDRLPPARPPDNEMVETGKMAKATVYADAVAQAKALHRRPDHATAYVMAYSASTYYERILLRVRRYGRRIDLAGFPADMQTGPMYEMHFPDGTVRVTKAVAEEAERCRGEPVELIPRERKLLFNALLDGGHRKARGFPDAPAARFLEDRDLGRYDPETGMFSLTHAGEQVARRIIQEDAAS